MRAESNGGVRDSVETKVPAGTAQIAVDLKGGFGLEDINVIPAWPSPHPRLKPLVGAQDVVGEYALEATRRSFFEGSFLGKS